jgi:hypothetical protein
MYKSAPISIRLLRNTKMEDDDRFDIIWKGEDTYQINYFDPATKNENLKRAMTILEGEQLDAYLTSLFNLVAQDSEPFQGIQIFIPCFPSLMFKPKQLANEGVQAALFQVMPLLIGATRLPKGARFC